MAQWVKDLLCEHEDLSSYLQDPHKAEHSSTCLWLQRPYGEMGHKDKTTPGSFESASMAHTTSNSKKLCLKQDGGPRPTPEVVFWIPYLCPGMHAPALTYTHTHIKHTGFGLFVCFNCLHHVTKETWRNHYNQFSDFFFFFLSTVRPRIILNDTEEGPSFLRVIVHWGDVLWIFYRWYVSLHRSECCSEAILVLVSLS